MDPRSFRSGGRSEGTVRKYKGSERVGRGEIRGDEGVGSAGSAVD